MNSIDKVRSMINEWKAQGIGKTDLMCNIGEAEIGYPYGWGATGQKCTVANREARMKNSKIAEGDKNLLRKRCQVLNGSKASCNGCKYYPDGECTALRDCIAFVNHLLDEAGIPHYGAGCSTMWNHAGNWEAKGKLADIPDAPCLVFQWYPGNEQKMQHIGFYDGKGSVYHCSVEVKKQPLSAYPWSHWGMPYGMSGDAPVVTHKTIRKGSSGPDVVLCQEDLIALGYDLSPYGADGKFGAKTETAVKTFQTSQGLAADGIVGRGTWAALDKAAGGGTDPEPKQTLWTVTIENVTRETLEKLCDAAPVGPVCSVTIRHVDEATAELLCTAYGGTKAAEIS